MTQALKAVEEFNQSGVIPEMGQRVHNGLGPGVVHVFPDGSVAIHWNDGAFTVGELVEEKEEQNGV